MRIGEKIRNLRIKEDWTQKELATRLGVAHNTISDYERDTKAVSIANLTKLCEIFGVEMSYFLESNEEMTINKNEQNKLILEDLLDSLIARGAIKDAENIDQDTLDMLIQVMKKDIKDKLKEQS